MSSTWEHKPLGDLLVVQNGYAFNSKEFSTKDGVPLIRIRDIKEGITTETNYTGEYDAKFIVKDGDLLIGMDGEFGCYKWKGPDALLNQRVCRLQEFSDDLVPQFLLYGINKYLKDIEDVTTFTTVKHLSSKTIKEIEFPVPPKEDQQRIVAILDEAFAGIATATANAEKNLQNARELFESTLKSVFAEKGDGWEERRLGDNSLLIIVDGDRGVNYPKKDDFFPEGHCLFLNTKNVRPDGFDFEETMFITKDKDSALRKGKLKRNDVIMTTRGTLGNLAVYDDSVDYEHVRINSGMLIFRPNLEKLLPAYLFEVLRSGIIKSQIALHSSGAAQPQLPINTLVNFTFPVPNTLKEQESIVNRLKEMSGKVKELEAIYKQKLNELAELKQSILQKAFAGELH